MAHFALVDENSIVRNVIAVSNCALDSCIGKDHWDYQEEYHKDHTGTANFPEQEALGQKVLADSGFEGKWLQTSFNAKFRGIFAGVGMVYDPVKDEFGYPTQAAN